MGMAAEVRASYLPQWTQLQQFMQKQPRAETCSQKGFCLTGGPQTFFCGVILGHVIVGLR